MIKIDLGSLASQISKFSSVGVKSTQTLDFVLASDKITINKDKQPASVPWSSLTPATEVVAQMDLTPANSQKDTNLQNDVNSQDNKTLFIEPKLKSNAYGDDEFAAALRSIRQGDVSLEYQDAFAVLDTCDENARNKILSSARSKNDDLVNSNANFRRLYQNNMIFALNPFVQSDLSISQILNAKTYGFSCCDT